jgi:DNA repair exonuclease SbcCD nuclease subunit
MLDTITLVHSSDLHIGDEETTRACGGDETLLLARVLDAARTVRADAVLLAGDVFENNRVPRTLADRVAGLVADAGRPVVVLPGNHDPLVADAVWRRIAQGGPNNLFVLGVTRPRAVVLPRLGLEVWGNPHRSYDDMAPLRAPRRRRTLFQVALAHGHYEPVPDRRCRLRPAWLIGAQEIAATGADYVALGHWNRATPVADGRVPAHYSGSPELSRSVNVVTLGRPDSRAHRAHIAHQPVSLARGEGPT